MKSKETVLLMRSSFSLLHVYFFELVRIVQFVQCNITVAKIQHSHFTDFSNICEFLRLKDTVISGSLWISGFLATQVVPGYRHTTCRERTTNVWYVSDEGSDFNDCQDESAPCRDLQSVFDAAEDRAAVYVLSERLSVGTSIETRISFHITGMNGLVHLSFSGWFSCKRKMLH